MSSPRRHDDKNIESKLEIKKNDEDKPVSNASISVENKQSDTRENPKQKNTLDKTNINRSTALSVLHKHFRDRTKGKLNNFPETKAKPGGRSAGYVATDTESKSTFMLKKSKSKDVRDTMTTINEYVTAPLYKRMLNERTPLVELVEDEKKEEPFLIRSKYLNKFKTVKEFTNNTIRSYELPALGLTNIKGFEKFIAAVLMGGESDGYDDNAGVMDIGAEDNVSPSYVYAKIDHGYSATNFFTNPFDMFKYLYGFCCDSEFYNNKIPVNAYLLENAMTTILSNLSEDEIENIVKSRIYQLNKAGFNPASCEFYLQENTREQPPVKVTSYSELEDHYIRHLKQTRSMVKQCCDLVSIVTHIDRPDKEMWLNSGKWVADIAGQDPLQWAKAKGYTIEGRNPDAVEAKLKKHFDSGSLLQVKAILDDVEVNNHSNNGPLLQAILAGDRKTAITQIEQGADLKQVNGNGDTAVIVAARKGDIELVLLLINKGADLNAKNKKNESASSLIMNSELRDWELIALLIEKGANLKARNIDLASFFMAALKEKKGELANEALKQNGITDIPNEVQKAIWQAVAIRNKTIMEALLKIAADSKDLDSKVEAVIAVMKMMSNTSKYTSDGTLGRLQKIVQSLINAGVDLIKAGNSANTPNNKGETLLMLACKDDLGPLVNLLLDAKVNIDAQDKNGDTALHYAAKGASDSFASLINRAENINAMNNQGKTVLELIVAMSQSNGSGFSVKSCKLLLEKGAELPSDPKARKAIIEFIDNNNIIEQCNTETQRRYELNKQLDAKPEGQILKK